MPQEDFAEDETPFIVPKKGEAMPAEEDADSEVFDRRREALLEECYASEEEGLPKKKKNLRVLWPLVIAAALFLLLAGGVTAAGLLVQRIETIYPGVHVEGVDLSEQTAEEAAQALTRLGHERYDYYSVNVNLPLENRLAVTTDAVGLTFSVKDAVSSAWHFGRDGGFVRNMLQYVQSKYLGKTNFTDDAGITVRLDEEKLRNLIHETAMDIDEQLLENGVVLKEDTLEVIKGASELRIDEEELFRMVSEAFMTASKETLTYESQPTLDEEYDFQSLYNEHYAEKAEAQLAYNPAYLPQDTEAKADPEPAPAEASAVDPAAEAEQEDAPDSFVEACYAVGATITDWEAGEKYRILPSTTGWFFDVSEAERLWAAAGYGDTVVIPLTIEEPELSTEKLTEMILGDVLSKNWTMYRFGYTEGYTEDIRTPLAGSTANRISNVKKACDLINDTILLPGEIFSCNAAFGQRTGEAGWLPAPAYANGEVRQENGGGICQVSSTLYNAVLYANLEIVERECHQFRVAYLPWGLDATLSWGWPDFKFKNDQDYPIIIKAWVDDDTNQCCFQIFGTDTDHVYVIMQFNNWYFYDTTGEYVDAEGNPLSIGMEAATWRLVYHDGDDYKTADPISNEYEAHSKYNDHKEDIEARRG